MSISHYDEHGARTSNHTYCCISQELAALCITPRIMPQVSLNETICPNSLLRSPKNLCTTTPCDTYYICAKFQRNQPNSFGPADKEVWTDGQSYFKIPPLLSPNSQCCPLHQTCELWCYHFQSLHHQYTLSDIHYTMAMNSIIHHSYCFKILPETNTTYISLIHALMSVI